MSKRPDYTCILFDFIRDNLMVLCFFGLIEPIGISHRLVYA